MHLFTVFAKLHVLNGQNIDFHFFVFPLWQIIVRKCSKRTRKEVRYIFCYSLQVERHVQSIMGRVYYKVSNREKYS